MLQPDRRASSHSDAVTLFGVACAAAYAVLAETSCGKESWSALPASFSTRLQTCVVAYTQGRERFVVAQTYTQHSCILILSFGIMRHAGMVVGWGTGQGSCLQSLLYIACYINCTGWQR